MKFLVATSLLAFFGLAHLQLYGKCYTPDFFKGECVHIRNCPALKEIHENRLHIFEDRFYLGLCNEACGHRDGEALVCCRHHSVPETTTPATTTAIPSKSLPPKNLLLPDPGFQLGNCGSDTIDKIYGGNLTKIDEFPWMALLEYSKPNNRKGFHCGGVLINDRYVLTASHCVNGKDLPVPWELTGVRLGEWDLTSEQDCDDELQNERVCNEKAVNIDIEKLIPHENYDPFSINQHHDIALLRLKERVTFSKFIKPICLPNKERLRNNDFVKQTMSVAGWGKTEAEAASSRKLKVNVDGVSNTDCNGVYNKESREIVDTQVCAGGVEGYDSCRGDSGGPLMRLDPPFWYLAGLVSFGPSPCGMKGWPGVYTRVSKYIPWIEANVKP